MCKLKSAIVLKDKIFMPDYDSHDRMLRELGIEDNYLNASKVFVRVELSPKEDVFSDVDTWVLGIDQDIKPDWFDAGEVETLMRKKVKEWANTHILINKDNLRISTSEGYYIKDCKNVDICDNAIVKEICGNTTVWDIRDRAMVRNIHGNTMVSDIFGNAMVDTICGNAAVKHISGDAMVNEICGNATVWAIGGRAVVSDILGDATVDNICSNALVESIYSNATIRNISHNATVKFVCNNATVKIVCDNATVMTHGLWDNVDKTLIKDRGVIIDRMNGKILCKHNFVIQQNEENKNV